MLLAFASVMCSSGTSPSSDPINLAELPQDDPGVRVAPECERTDLQPVCSEARLIGERALVDSVAGHRRKAPAVLEVTPAGQVRYRVGLRVSDATLGTILRQYSFEFEGWQTVEESDALLVYRKSMDTAPFVATIRVTPAAQPNSYDVRAELTTDGPVAR